MRLSRFSFLKFPRQLPIIQNKFATFCSQTTPTLHHPTRIYQSHHFDSKVWDDFKPRSGDAIITTSLKCGTTWTQNIVGHLIFKGEDPPDPIAELSPWIDLRVPPRNVKMPFIEEQKHRRFLKTHLPSDGIPIFPECRYIYVARHGLDVFMSLVNHWKKGNDLWYEILNDSPDRVGDPFPRFYDDIHKMYDDWVSKGWFEWENEGYPFWSTLYHINSWWKFRDAENVLFVHYDDLLSDLPKEVDKIATFLDISTDDGVLEKVVEKSSFGYMKKNAANVAPLGGAIFEGGGGSFINKGTNGRWKDILSEEEVNKYKNAASKALAPECYEWLHRGEM